jgi:hypothetical protein
MRIIWQFYGWLRNWDGVVSTVTQYRLDSPDFNSL